MSHSVSFTDAASPSRFTKNLDRASSDRPPAVRPAFSRTLPVASGDVAGIKDKGIPIREHELRALSFDHLNTTGRAKLDAWATRVPGVSLMNAPNVSELPGGPFPDTMIAIRMPDGSVSIRPSYLGAFGVAPSMVVQRSHANSADVEFELNGKLLTKHSPVEDIRLAINLVELL
ncbi:hypothetical protein ACSFA3_17425 [Variovorax sp. RHLX14]|uniref:hypothetical protein n=1 Tax=Variovorax sp. RHLX14 TaxID=1259731 RepID=UPI003F45C56D